MQHDFIPYDAERIDDHELFTIKQAAHFLKMSTRNLRRLVGSRTIATIRQGCRIYFTYKDICTYINSRRVDVVGTRRRVPRKGRS